MFIMFNDYIRYEIILKWITIKNYWGKRNTNINILTTQTVSISNPQKSILKWL